MSETAISRGHMALYQLTGALARAEGDDAILLAEAFEELAERAEEFLLRVDTPESAALKCANARAAIGKGASLHASLGISAPPGARAESPAGLEHPRPAPQSEADSGARVVPSAPRAAPLNARSP